LEQLSSRLYVPTTFLSDLDTALDEIFGYDTDRVSGGFVNREIIKAKFEADYIIAHRFRQGKSDLMYSIDGDLIVLCGPSCLAINSLQVEKSSMKKQKRNDESQEVLVYSITGGSNTYMRDLQHHIEQHFPTSDIKFQPGEHPLLETTTNPLISFVCSRLRM
jgi:hypothetical protein